MSRRSTERKSQPPAASEALELDTASVRPAVPQKNPLQFTSV
jgi:hypothetical protein